MSSSGASGVVRLRVICGPTAAGKTALALRLAEVYPLAIISADSRQIYRGFDIGTAKPARDERARVPHYGLDVAEPTTRFSAAAWAAQVPGWLQEAAAANRTPVVVGGTGFYLRALFAPLFVAPPLDEHRRQMLDQYIGALDRPELQRWVSALDPSRAHLGPAQKRRAIETALLTGTRISDMHGVHARAPWVTARYLLVDPGLTLSADIEARVDRMLEDGWLEEVKALAAHVPAAAPAWSATGYELLREVVQGSRSLADAQHQIVVRTRQYAKRQRTWFRHQLPAEDVTTIDPRAAASLDRALAWWEE